MWEELQLTASDVKPGILTRSDSSIIAGGNLLNPRSMDIFPNMITSTPAIPNSYKPEENSVDSTDGVTRNIQNSHVTTSSTSSNCKTPARVIFGSSRTPGSSRGTGSSDRFRINRGSLRTPSGPRMNPFDSHISMDILQGPTFSPSVFSTVVSPSQESSLTGRFWSVDQQANLFPAHISDDSPWKQEMAMSRLDPELENRTQEAIDLYFSRHSHQITSPDDFLPNSRSMMLSNRSVLMTSNLLGGSPNLTRSAIVSANETPVAMESSIVADSKILGGKVNSVFSQGDQMDNSANGSVILPSTAKRHCSQWTQTECTFPSVLPPELEAIVSKYFTFKDDQSTQPKSSYIPSSSVVCSTQQACGSNDEGNNSTLRRKLFAGVGDNDSDESNDEDSDERQKVDDFAADSDKENVEFSNILILPGSMMMTPTATKKDKSPNKSLSWSLSPVSRKKCTKGPLGFSTPTKT